MQGCLPGSPRAAAPLSASCYCRLILARRVGSWRGSRSLPAGGDLLLQPPEKGEELPVPGRTAHRAELVLAGKGCATGGRLQYPPDRKGLVEPASW